MKKQKDLAPLHTPHFNMQAEGYTHAFQSTSFTVEEFRKGSQRMRSYKQTLAERLNSGERFGNNSDFQAELTFIRTPPSGKGQRKKCGQKKCRYFF